MRQPLRNHEIGVFEFETGLEALHESPAFRGPVESTTGHSSYDHLALIYETQAEQFAAVIPYIKDGLEQRQRERSLEESNERLEQFAYAASHDLQEPLRMVTSYLQLLESRYADAFDEEREEFLESAIDGADRMRETIDGLLEYSWIQTRGDPFETVDLNAVLENVQADLQVCIEESDARITFEELPRSRGTRDRYGRSFGTSSRTRFRTAATSRRGCTSMPNVEGESGSSRFTTTASESTRNRRRDQRSRLRYPRPRVRRRIQGRSRRPDRWRLSTHPLP